VKEFEGVLLAEAEPEPDMLLDLNERVGEECEYRVACNRGELRMKTIHELAIGLHADWLGLLSHDLFERFRRLASRADCGLTDDGLVDQAACFEDLVDADSNLLQIGAEYAGDRCLGGLRDEEAPAWTPAGLRQAVTLDQANRFAQDGAAYAETFHELRLCAEAENASSPSGVVCPDPSTEIHPARRFGGRHALISATHPWELGFGPLCTSLGASNPSLGPTALQQASPCRPRVREIQPRARNTGFDTCPRRGATFYLRRALSAPWAAGAR
jgi:hypothetical protein